MIRISYIMMKAAKLRSVSSVAFGQRSTRRGDRTGNVKLKLREHAASINIYILSILRAEAVIQQCRSTGLVVASVVLTFTRTLWEAAPLARTKMAQATWRVADRARAKWTQIRARQLGRSKMQKF
jgi:hypothetical protein